MPWSMEHPSTSVSLPVFRACCHLPHAEHQIQPGFLRLGDKCARRAATVFTGLHMLFCELLQQLARHEAFDSMHPVVVTSGCLLNQIKPSYGVQF